MVMAFAGSFILISLALAHWHSPNGLWFTAFVGANLVQASFGGFLFGLIKLSSRTGHSGLL
ncbi:hypothetical protein [Methylomonas sp. EFPC1]|uniref:hypothetical protein n=1 Tax=Methylomonas sp. EFPC1 TaxID=2812647 RepID=UPI0023DDBB9F|nr:hypothetical protein [Methylomonas sp. EFPC1]